MNCYTVVGGETQLGIALMRSEALRTHVLRLGSKESGVERIVALAPSSPAAHVLVACGVRLMRTATLLQVGEGHEQFVFGHAKHGLKADTTDLRALVLLDFVSSSRSLECSPASQLNIPIQGFEKRSMGNGEVYRVQALAIMELNQSITFYDSMKKLSYTVGYNFDPTRDRFPCLLCMPANQFRARQSKRMVAV